MNRSVGSSPTRMGLADDPRRTRVATPSVRYEVDAGISGRNPAVAQRVVATVVKRPLRLPDIVVMVASRATAIRATIRPYSTIVAPSSPATNERAAAISFDIDVSPVRR